MSIRISMDANQKSVLSFFQSIKQLYKLLKECDCIRFSDCCWYKFMKKTATKNSIFESICGILNPDGNTIAFEDDYAGSALKLC